MPNSRPFPSKDSDLNVYVQMTVPYLITNATRLKVTADNQSAMSARLSEWNAEYPASQNPDTRTKTNIQNKDIARKEIINVMRSVFADVPASALTTQDRNTLNLPLREGTNTPNPVPTTTPIGQVDTSRRLEHTISFTDEDGAIAKPKGVRGCQVWYKIGTAPIDPKELTFLATNTSSPQVNTFDGEHAGQPAYYWLRWENTRGETGPWSDAVMATITG